MKIVSLLPSATEIVCSLGLTDQLVGVSHECDYPAEVQQLPHLTRSAIPKGLDSREIDAMVRDQLADDMSLYHLNIELLQDLQPDLIVTQTLCNVCAVAESEVTVALSAVPFTPQVIYLEPTSLGEVFDSIKEVAKAIDYEAKAFAVVADLQSRVDAIADKTLKLDPETLPRVAFLEWTDPVFNAGHWISELVQLAGGVDCLGSPQQPSTTISDEAFIASQPDVLFIAQCGFDAQRTRQDLARLQALNGWDTLPCVQNDRLYYADGNAYFSRPGPRLVDSLEILSHNLHPEQFPLPEHLNAANRFDERTDLN